MILQYLGFLKIQTQIKKINIRSFYNTRCINGGNSVEHTDLWMYLNKGPKIYSEHMDFFFM